jgi:hypothetical protein
MRSRKSEQSPSLPAPTPLPFSAISTERIMSAVEQQRRITSQLESLQAQQQARLAGVNRAGLLIIAVIFAMAGAATLGLVLLFTFQPDLFLGILLFSSGIVDVVMQLARYLSTGLTFIAGQNWLLAGTALVIVVMMGIWLRLLRTPQEL